MQIDRICKYDEFFVFFISYLYLITRQKSAGGELTALTLLMQLHSTAAQRYDSPSQLCPQKLFLNVLRKCSRH